MIVRYDSLDRFENPNLVLCNPGSVFTRNSGTLSSGTISRSLFQLDHISDMEISFNFNTTSELNFRMILVGDDDPQIALRNRNMYRALQNRRLIFVEDIGYFVITNIEIGFDGNQDYKDVTATSIEAEIQTKTVPYIPDGTYRFSSYENIDGLFDKIVAELPLWNIDYVDSAVSSKYRTFSDVDVSTNCLGFMLDSMQEAYECIFVFDIIDRTISVYDQANYAHESSIHITKDDVISSLNITENADDLYTSLMVIGSQDEIISAVNPTGNNTIYRFDYYIDWMTPELAYKVRGWEDEIDEVQQEYYDLNLEYYQLLSERNTKQLDNEKLNTQLTMYGRARENIEATGTKDNIASYNAVIEEAGGEPIDISGEIQDIKRAILDLMDPCYSYISINNARIEEINARITQLQSGWDYHRGIFDIRNSLAFNAYFTTEELDELSNYIYAGNYKDDYIVITDEMDYEAQFEQMNLMYQRAKNNLYKISQPTQEFSIDADSFIFEKDFKHWSEQLETGCVINVELEAYPSITFGEAVLDSYSNDVAALFMSNMTINYEDHHMSMTFGNRLNRYDTKALFDNVLGNISKTSNSLSYVKEIVTPIKDGQINRMQQMLNSSRDLTMAAAMAATNQDVVIDATGYSGRKMNQDGSYDPNQVKITAENIVFTTDSWDTSSTAIGKILMPDGSVVYGINAGAIIGDLIMGDKLVIIDDNGNPILSVLDAIKANVQGNTNAIGEANQALAALTPENLQLTIQNVIKDTEIDHVTTSTNYTFDQNGLNISKSGKEMSTLIDEDGMDVIRNDGSTSDVVLKADSTGVNALNLHARQFLEMGKNSRFEDYKTTRTACYYVGT